MQNRFWHPLMMVMGLGLWVTGCVSVSTGSMLPTSVPKMASTTEVATGGITTTPAVTANSPKSPRDVRRIKPQELKSLLDQGADIEILDTQSAQGFAAMHIPEVFNQPWATEIKSAMSLPKDKWVVLYCASDNERDSSDVAFQLITRFKYTQIMVLEGGIVEWKKLGYPVETSFWD